MIPASDLLNRRTGVFLFYFIGMAVCMHKKRMHIPAEIHLYHCCKNIRFHSVKHIQVSTGYSPASTDFFSYRSHHSSDYYNTELFPEIQGADTGEQHFAEALWYPAPLFDIRPFSQEQGCVLPVYALCRRLSLIHI